MLKVILLRRNTILLLFRRKQKSKQEEKEEDWQTAGHHPPGPGHLNSSSINSHHGSHTSHIIMTIISISLSYLQRNLDTNQSERLLLWKQSCHQLPRDGGVSWRPNDMSKCKAPQQCTVALHYHGQEFHGVCIKMHRSAVSRYILAASQ